MFTIMRTGCQAGLETKDNFTWNKTRILKRPKVKP